MGLDMYLSKKTYVKNWDHMSKNEKISIKISGNTKGIKTNRISDIIESIGYWRKANQIHKWFVDNVQNGNDDCGEYYVERSDFELLLKTCKEVQKSGYNSQVCENLLNTCDGFFFGSTVLPNTSEYVKADQFYIDDVEYTINLITEILDNWDNNHGVYYYSSSW